MGVRRNGVGIYRDSTLLCRRSARMTPSEERHSAPASRLQRRQRTGGLQLRGRSMVVVGTIVAFASTPVTQQIVARVFEESGSLLGLAVAATLSGVGLALVAYAQRSEVSEFRKIDLAAEQRVAEERDGVPRGHLGE